MYNNKLINFYISQCLIGDGDIVMTCIVKVSAMIQQIQSAVKRSVPTKITIENFQKRQGKIFTSESTIIELDNAVSNYSFSVFLIYI